jgi:hypothetical protein
MKTKFKISTIISLTVFLAVIETANAFYDPGLQRWINRDPLGDAASLPAIMSGIKPNDEVEDGEGMTNGDYFDAWIDINRNLYGAMGNNPVNRVDTLGLASPQAACGVAIASGNVAQMEALLGVAGEIGLTAAQQTALRNAIAAAAAGTIAVAKEHTKGARPSTREDHENAEKRRKVDQGGEKGDANRAPKSPTPRGPKPPKPEKPPEYFKGPKKKECN